MPEPVLKGKTSPKFSTSTGNNLREFWYFLGKLLGFYRCCAPGASAPVVVKNLSPSNVGGIHREQTATARSNSCAHNYRIDSSLERYCRSEALGDFTPTPRPTFCHTGVDQITTKYAGGSAHCKDNMLPRRRCFPRNTQSTASLFCKTSKILLEACS